MADAGTSYAIDIEAEVEGGGAAAAKLVQLANALDSAGAAAVAASADLSAAQVAYKQNEQGANNAAKRVENLALKLGKAQDAQQKLATSGDAVNVAAYRRAETKVKRLATALQKAKPKADALSAALKKEAAALDLVASKAKKAAKAHQKASSAFKSGRKSFGDTKALKKGTGSMAELAEGLNNLGGPLGRAGGRAAQTAEAVQKLGKSLGVNAPARVDVDESYPQASRDSRRRNRVTRVGGNDHLLPLSLLRQGA